MGVKTLFSLTQESLEDGVVTDENMMELSEEELHAPIDAIISDEMSLEEIESEIEDVQELIRVNTEAVDQLVTLLEAKKEKLTAVSTESENKDEGVTISFEEIALMANEAKVIYASIGYGGAKEVSTEGLEDDPKAYLEAVISVEEQAIEDIEDAILSAEGIVSDLIDKISGGLKKLIGNYSGAAKNLYKLVESKEKAGAEMKKETLPSKGLPILSVSTAVTGSSMININSVTGKTILEAVESNNKLFIGIIKDIVEGITAWGSKIKIVKEEDRAEITETLSKYVKSFDSAILEKMFGNSENTKVIKALGLEIDSKTNLIIGCKGNSVICVSVEIDDKITDDVKEGIYGYKNDVVKGFTVKTIKINTSKVSEAKTLTLGEVKELAKVLLDDVKSIDKKVNDIYKGYDNIKGWKEITSLKTDKKKMFNKGAFWGALIFLLPGMIIGSHIANKGRVKKVMANNKILSPESAFGGLDMRLRSLQPISDKAFIGAYETYIGFEKDVLKYGSMSLAAHGKAKKEPKEDETEE